METTETTTEWERMTGILKEEGNLGTYWVHFFPGEWCPIRVINCPSKYHALICAVDAVNRGHHFDYPVSHGFWISEADDSRAYPNVDSLTVTQNSLDDVSYIQGLSWFRESKKELEADEAPELDYLTGVPTGRNCLQLYEDIDSEQCEKYITPLWSRASHFRNKYGVDYVSPPWLCKHDVTDDVKYILRNLYIPMGK